MSVPIPAVMHAREPITVVVSRFEDLVSRGLQAMVEEDDHIEVVAWDVPVAALEAALAEHAPKVCIVNFGSLPASVEVHRLHVAHPGTRLLVLGNRPSAADCSQLLAFGATACLAKDTQTRDIVNAIHLASRGLHVLPRSTQPSSGPEVLTQREAEVLAHLRAGASNAQIAASLHVSIETVRTHARSVFRKLGVHSRREIVALGR